MVCIFNIAQKLGIATCFLCLNLYFDIGMNNAEMHCKSNEIFVQYSSIIFT